MDHSFPALRTTFGSNILVTHKFSKYGLNLKHQRFKILKIGLPLLQQKFFIIPQTTGNF